MAHIRYDILPQGGGWSIAMGGAVGPPYAALDDALADVDAVARFLADSGDSVEIVTWRGGEPLTIERVEPWQQAHGSPAFTTRSP